MKKIIAFLLFFFVPSLVFAADCTIGQFADGTVTNTANCETFVIDSLERLGEVTFNNNEFKDIEFNGVIVDDLSFLKSARAERVIFINSKVDLDNWDIFSPIVFFRATYIMDDDLSGLAKNTIMENLSFDNCWLGSLETLKKLDKIPTLTDFAITANRYLHLNLDPIMYLPNLTTVGLNYMQQNASTELKEYFTRKGITVPGVPFTADIGIDFDENVNDIDYKVIRQITLNIVKNFSIVNTTRTVKSFAEAYESKQATQVELALILSYYLQDRDFKTAHILGHESGAGMASSIYVMVFFNNKWNVIDVVGLKNNPAAITALENNEETDLFMKDASTKFVTGGAALDESLIDYMDYSFHIGYVLPAGNVRIQILPLDLSTYSLLEGNVEGYTFHGWYLDESYTKPFTNDDEINKNLVLYGKFEGNKTTPIPDGGTGDGTVTPPNTGMFMGIWIILPIVALIAIEWYRNKRFNSMGGI